MRRLLPPLLTLALLGAACDGRRTDSTVQASAPVNGAMTTTTTTEPTTSTTHEPHETTTTTLPPGVVPMAVPVVRHPVTRDLFYFVMTDRFENGDPENDTGGLGGDQPLVSGFLPTDVGYFHGGDLAGLEARLDYLAGLGVTAVWVTPPFVNRTVQGDGTVAGSSAGYHGYWQIDYTRIDPHLGTDADMRSFVDAAHERGIKVFFDVVANHTGDVIGYAGEPAGYVGKDGAPYLDAAGTAFDDALFAGTGDFPELDASVSFPYTPVFADPADATAKAPAWLNDPTLYHNRGNSTFVGENSLYGDFFGLDDLFTEHPVVVVGMTEIFTSMIDDYDIDGFRVDTVKHVNDEFWQAVIPAVLNHAEESGKVDFFVFGEVFDDDAIFTSRYTTSLPFPGLLDFGFSGAAMSFVADGKPSRVLEDHFFEDDWYTDADSNASMLVKFAGNHDIGRLGYAVRRSNAGADEAAVLRRMELAMELMFFSRGVPLVYYGDEQGFVGDGGDRDARQDMFPSQVATYNDDDLIGTDATTAMENFDTAHPLYGKIAELAALRAEHPALATGNHQSRWSEGEAGVYAFSRIDRIEQVEYLVLLNNAEELRTASFDVASPAGTVYEVIYGPDPGPVTAGERPDVTVAVPPLSAVVYRATEARSRSSDTPTVRVTAPAPDAVVSFDRFRIAVTVDGTSFCGRTCWPGLFMEVTFAVRVDDGEWIVLGTDDAPPYKVFWDSTAHPDGARVEVLATVDDLMGGTTAAWSSFTLGRR